MVESDRQILAVGGGVNLGNRAVLYAGRPGPTRSQQSTRSKPATVLDKRGCTEEFPGAQQITISCGIRWGRLNQPTASPRRSYVCGRAEWGSGNGSDTAEFDWKQGTQLTLPAGGQLRITAWIQEFDPDPGIQLAAGGIAPQAPLTPAQSYDDLNVSCSLCAGAGLGRASATKTYPQQLVAAGNSLYWRVPQYAHSVLLYSPTPIPIGTGTFRLLSFPEATDATVFAETDLGSVVAGPPSLRETPLPGGVTHIEADTGIDALFSPVFSLAL